MPYRLIDPKYNPKLRAVLHTIAGLATGILAVGAIFLGLKVLDLTTALRETQLTNTAKVEQDRIRDARTAATAADAARAAKRIEECTTPGRDCFEDGQRRLRGTVASINDYALAAAYCADRPDAQTVVELEVCIRARIVDARRQAQ